VSARRDERLAKAGQEVRVSAMKRMNGDRSEVDRGNGEEEEGPLVPPSRDSDGATAPTDSRRGRKRQKHSALELEDLLVLNQEKKAEQDSLKLKLETDRLDFDKERAAVHERNEEKRLELL
jgi:hypothetical protein